MGSELVVGMQSALGYWRLVRRSRSEQGWVRTFGARRLMLAERVSLAAAVCGVDEVEAIVTKAGQRQSAAGLRVHVWDGDAMATPIGRDVLVSGPAQAIVQLGVSADEIEIAQAAYELCGTYALASELERGFETHVDPLVDIDGLRACAEAERQRGAKGAAKVCRALRLVRDGSNSPMETNVAIALATSRKAGGYGLGGFELNRSVELSEDAARIFGYPTMRPDFSWPGSNHVLEVLGRHDHGGDLGFRSDPKRADALLAMDKVVHWLTTEQLRSPEKTEAILEDLARKLGKRRRPPTPGMVLERAALHERLFGFGADS